MNEYCNCYVQNYTCENGEFARIVIPEEATVDDLKGIRDMLDIVIRRHFGIILKQKEGL